jgi:hypothetical protein
MAKRNLAPEPFLSGCIKMMASVALYCRNHSDGFSREQAFDLGDALHNIDETLLEYGASFDEESFRRIFLRAYDEKWAHLGLSLEQKLDEGIAEARRDLEMK